MRSLTLTAAGVIHRDVSPANIIITAQGVAKLTDFGLARGATDMRLSTSGAPLGSPWYMSPEQVKGGHERWMPVPTFIPWAQCSTKCSQAESSSRRKARSK